jgi:hypothetical protein
MTPRTANIIADIRKRLDDREYKTIDSDEYIYPVLSTLQSYLGTSIIIRTVNYELDMFTGQSEYPIDRFIQKITDVQRKNATDPELNIEISGVTGDNERILTVNNPEAIIDGQVLILKCWMRPALSDGDVIDDETDPVLDEYYDNYLTELFLSDYKSKNESFRTREVIEKELIAYVNSLLTIDFSLFSDSRSVRLANEIRIALNDKRYERIENDLTIYNTLTKIQAYLGTNYPILRDKYQVTLENGTPYYTLPKGILKITDVSRYDKSDPALKIEITGKLRDDERTLIVNDPEDIQYGQSLLLDCFVRPLTKIDRYNEPLLPEQYDKYLKELFLSQYAATVKEFRTREQIEKELIVFVAKQLSIEYAITGGNRSVKLCNEIRLALNDKTYDLIENNLTIYSQLTDIINNVATTFLISKVDYELDMSSSQRIYPIDDFVLKIIGIKPFQHDDPDLEISVNDNSDADDRYIEVYNPELIPDGFVMKFKAYIRPLLTDIIDRYNEPCINARYDPFIKELFLSNYRKVNEEFRKKADVEESLKKFVLDNMSVDKITPIDNPFNSMQF